MNADLRVVMPISILLLSFPLILPIVKVSKAFAFEAIPVTFRIQISKGTLQTYSSVLIRIQLCLFRSKLQIR